MVNSRNKPHQPATDPESAAVTTEQSDSAQEKLASIGMSRGRRRPDTIFGIRKRHTGMRGGGPTDYTKRYGKDFFGKEMSSSGRFWLTYLDEALIFDEEMVEMYKDTIDVLLVFAGLFSAVVSTFVIQSVQNLQPDYTAVSASLLAELVGNQQTTSNIPIPSSPSSPSYLTTSFSPSTTDVLVNSLWFISLTLSLITALVAVLTKQWLHQYISVVSDISPLSRGRIRQYRYMGLEKWQVPMIIGFLPILLHISLFLFFLGLCFYLFALHAVIAYAVASLTGTVFTAYIVCLFLPLVCHNCPYKTSLTDWMFRAIYGVISRFIRCKDLPRTAKDAERIKAGGDEERLKAGDAIDTEAISWLHSTSSNTSAQRIALEAALPIHHYNPCGNAKSIIDEIFKRHTGGLKLETRPSPAASEPLRKIRENTKSSLLAMLDPVLPKDTMSSQPATHHPPDSVPPKDTTPSQPATCHLPSTALPEEIWTCLLNYEEWEVSPRTESASSVTQLAAKLMEAWREGLTSGPSWQPSIPFNKPETGPSDNVEAGSSDSVEAGPLQKYLSSPSTEVTSALFSGLSMMTHSFFESSPGDLVDVMRMFGDQLRDGTNPQNDNLLVQGISDTIEVIQKLRVTPKLSAQDPKQKTCAQNAFLISSSCIFPKAEKPETHLALLKILCCSDHYAFTLTDMHSQPVIFFANAIRCFLSSQSKAGHLRYETKVVERILGPFFNQGYITDRDHTQVKFLRFFGSYFELKDRKILLDKFEEAGGLRALSVKYSDLLRGSATPEELAPGINFAHLITNQMIETNIFDPLHLLDSAKKPPYIDNLSVLIGLLRYNSSGLLTTGPLLETLREKLQRWMVDKREQLGRLHNIEDINRVPELLLEKIFTDD